MIKLDVKGLKEEKGSQRHFDVEANLPELDSDENKISFAGPAQIHVDLTNTGLGILVTGDIHASVNTECARCLESFKYPVRTDFLETYYDGEKRPFPKMEGEEEFIPFKGDEIDIQPEVLKSIVLALPIRALCSELCKGLCSQCGNNLNERECGCSQDNVDPRMVKLKELLEQ